MFSTDFIFRQQENLVDNQKCQAGFRPLCNKIPPLLIKYQTYLLALMKYGSHSTARELKMNSTSFSFWNCLCSYILRTSQDDISMDRFFLLCWPTWDWMRTAVARAMVHTISGRKELGIYKYLSIIDVENIFNQKLFYL